MVTIEISIFIHRCMNIKDIILEAITAILMMEKCFYHSILNKKEIWRVTELRSQLLFMILILYKKNNVLLR